MNSPDYKNLQIKGSVDLFRFVFPLTVNIIQLFVSAASQPISSEHVMFKMTLSFCFELMLSCFHTCFFLEFAVVFLVFLSNFLQCFSLMLIRAS